VFLLVSVAVPAAADEAKVTVGHNRIEPAEVAISAGDSVEFHNVDQMPGGHTIVADDGSFSSPALAKDQTWSREFEKAGSYPFHIREHPEAKGKIVVK
jgi:plastocyanin